MASQAAAPAAERAAVGAPLAGVRVLDFTSYASGPYCTLMLALLGAEVIRVESATRLDLNRRPHPLYGRMEIPVFDHLAGSKRSVTLNLKTDRGVALARELIAISDVVAENFRPGVMERLGIDWPVVHELNPRAVMVSISAYGQQGPDSRRPGYAPVFGAEGGLGYIQGHPDGPPFEVRNQMDHQVGLTAAMVVVALLAERDATGVGARGDVAACEVASMLVGESIVAAMADPDVPLRPGNHHERWCPHNVYPTAGGGWIAVAVRSDPEWARLVDVAGVEELRAERWATADGRLPDGEAIDALIGSWTAGREGVGLAAELQSAGVCAEISMSARDIVEDEHLRERGSLVEIEHPEHGRRLTVQTPWRYAHADAGYTEWSPELGCDNDAVICGLLGHDPEELRRWIDEGAVH